jgi:PilZ domain
MMSNNGRAIDGKPAETASELRSGGAAARTEEADANAAGPFSDLQSAARFPIKLPISVKSNSGESRTETENISANGVLFQMDASMPVGSPLDFTISLPADVVGADMDVQVDCRGRVVRSFADGERVGVGVVIDEYHFKRADRLQEN